MTTLMKLPEGFNPAYAPQPMNAGPRPNPYQVQPGGDGFMANGGAAFSAPTFSAPTLSMPDAMAMPQARMMQNGGQSAVLPPQMMQNRMAQNKAGTAAQTTNTSGDGGNWYDGLVPTSPTDDSGGWGGFGNFFSGLGEWLSGNSDAITGIGSITGALMNANETRQLGTGIQAYLDSLGQQLNTDSQFQGYGVTTGAGQPVSTVGYDDDGKFNLNLGVGPNADLMLKANTAMGNLTGVDGLLAQAAGMRGGQSNVDYAANAATAMQKSLADPSARQQEVYNQMMAVQNPELNRMQAEQQAAEYARGRGGIRGSQYGGTAEDAAMARARAQASNEAMMGAMQQTNAEREQFGNMAAQYAGAGNQAVNAYTGLGSMLGNLAGQQGTIAGQQAALAYLPMQQQMALMGLGQSNADMAQTGQLTGLDYMTQLALGGTNANMQAQHSANQLTGNIYDTLLSNIGGAQGSDGGSSSGLLGAFGSGFEWLGSLFGDD